MVKIDSPSPQELSRDYLAMLDSVNLINKLVPKNQEDLDTLDRNVRHLELMISRDWWTTASYDLETIATAIQAGKDKQQLTPQQEPS